MSIAQPGVDIDHVHTTQQLHTTIPNIIKDDDLPSRSDLSREIYELHAKVADLTHNVYMKDKDIDSLRLKIANMDVVISMQETQLKKLQLDVKHSNSSLAQSKLKAQEAINVIEQLNSSINLHIIGHCVQGLLLVIVFLLYYFQKSASTANNFVSNKTSQVSGHKLATIY